MGRVKIVNSVVLLWLILECAFAKPSSKYGPPKIKNMGSETIIDAGHNLTLFCEGSEKITWTYPNNTIQDIYWSTASVETSESYGKYYAKLTLLNASFVDVDFYYCHAENAAKDEKGRSASIYIYVRDEERLSVKPYEELVFITANQHSTIHLPCRPTSPDIQVELLGINGEEMSIPFDHHIGFTLKVMTLLHSGHYTCIFERGNKTEELIINLYVGSHTDYAPKPFIEAPNNGRTKIGTKYILNCTVTIEQNVYFTLEWKVPNPSGIKTGRIINATAVAVDDPHGSRQGSSSLTINNVQFEDNGEYSCIITDHNNKTNSVSKNITVFDENGSYIKLQEETEMNTINATAGPHSVQWVVIVDSFPKAEIIWTNNRGEEITSNTRNTKYVTSFDSNNNKATLKITQLTLNDSGIYQITANNGKAERNLNLSLNVQDRPTVLIESPNYHILNESTSVKCIAAGNPIPTVHWFFKPCQNNSCSFSRVQPKYYKSERINLQVISTLTLNATRSGFVQCSASNIIANDTTVQGFYVTDVEEGFKIWSSDKNDQIAAGSNVILFCAVSKYNYTNDIKWYKESGSDKILILPTKKYEIDKNITEYTYRSSLKIYSISKNDSATYLCETESLDTGREDPRLLKITVKDPIIPTIYHTNMNDSTVKLATGKEILWYCSADGIPAPTIVWKKDGTIFGLNNNRVSLSENNRELAFKAVIDEDSGTYTCEAKNSEGIARRSMVLEVTGTNRAPNFVLILATLVLAIFFIALVIILILKIRKEKRQRLELKNCGLQNFEAGALECLNPELGIDEQAELLPYDKKWEFPRDKLKLGKQLGSGAFGVVMKAEAFGIVEGETITTVAVKMVKRNADYTYIKALASELKIMVHLGKHLNVVNLLGACTKNVTKRELFVIVEYCRYGNLHNYLLRHRDDFVNQIDMKTGMIDTSIGADLLSRTMSVASNRSGNRNMAFAGVDYRAAPNVSCTSDSSVVCSPTGEDVMILSNNSSVQPEWRSNYRGDYKGNVRPTSTHDLLCWSFQVARGMEYLASRKVMHGDLAARNILLAEENIVKICDFGLAKSIYKSDNYKKKGDGPLPVKWMAVESIRDRVFSTQSDVWSFGIVLWELFSLARTPYPGMDADERLYNKLVDGYRMDQPEFATKEIYQLMSECWHGKPVYRPTFTKLAEDLGDMLQDAVKKHYIDLNDPYIMMNTEQLAGHSDYLSMACAPDYGNLSSPGHEYVNGKPFSEEQEPEASGYLPMDIFSPRNNESIFDFEVSKNKNVDGEQATGIELLPMLNSTESDSETSPGPVKSFSNPNYQSNPKGAKNSEPKKDSIVSTSDNYINMPQQKNSMKTNTDSFSNPNYIQMNKSIIGDENEKSNYVNSNSRDWERPIV